MITDEQIALVNNIDSRYIPHAAIRNAVRGIERSIALSKGSNEPVNMMLTGNAGTGKTTACKAILEKYGRKLNVKKNCAITVVPAFYSSIPHPVTIKGVASSMLMSLGDVAPTKGSALELTYRLGILLTQCRTEVIILDELQHLLKRDLGRTDSVKDWLKTIINKFKVPIVIVGTPECSNIINTDPQLARRFTTRFELKNLDYGGSKKGEYRKFIESLALEITELLKLDDFLDLRTRHNSLAMYAATGGNPADTINLFKTAILIAFESNKKQVALKDFQSALDALALPNTIVSNKNPFELNSSSLETAITNRLRGGI